MVTKEQAMTSRYFYHMTEKYADGGPRVYRANGQCKTWKTRPDEFQLPVKFGWRDCAYITQSTAKHFTVDESECTPDEKGFERFSFRYHLRRELGSWEGGIGSQFFKPSKPDKDSYCNHIHHSAGMVTAHKELGRSCKFFVGIHRQHLAEMDFVAYGDYVKEELPKRNLGLTEDDVVCEPVKDSKKNFQFAFGLILYVRTPKPVMCPDHVMDRINAERATISYNKQIPDKFVPGERIVRMYNSVPQPGLTPLYYSRSWKVFVYDEGTVVREYVEHQIKAGDHAYFVRSEARFEPYCFHYRKKESQS